MNGTGTWAMFEMGTLPSATSEDEPMFPLLCLANLFISHMEPIISNDHARVLVTLIGVSVQMLISRLKRIWPKNLRLLCVLLLGFFFIVSPPFPTAAATDAHGATHLTKKKNQHLFINSLIRTALVNKHCKSTAWGFVVFFPLPSPLSPTFAHLFGSVFISGM